ncbi:cache domain-containing sensor histidine kinase [Cohnella phaseoli]|uniref:histidine kinase n=1 Tax=Cohnella phaseoli TaxID=456490 RepID=A0A3D9I5L3_9BACL|nr:sensor histidine kinase [Cohnella phaseoli]RED57064.1 two-component system sensor histidine kinase YesM [Cohnella phaseoli]
MKTGWFPFFSNLNLRPKLIILFMISVVVPLIVFGSILYRVSAQEVEVEMRQTSLQTVQQMSLTLDEYVRQIDTLSKMPYTSPEAERYLLGSSNVKLYTDKYSAADVEAVETFLENLLKVRQDIEFVSLVSLNGNIVSRSRAGAVKAQYDFYKEPIYENLRKSTGEKTMVPLHEADYLFGGKKRVFSIGRKVLSFHEGFYIGYILIDYNENAIIKIGGGASIGKTGSVLLLDKYGNVMHSSGQLARSSGTEDILRIAADKENMNEVLDVGGDKRILVSSVSEYTGWKVVGVLPYEDILQRVKGIKTVFYAMGIICVTLVFAFSMLVSKGVVKPIRLLQSTMRQVEKGDTEAKVTVRSRNELGQLSLSFNRLIEKLNVLLRTIKSVETKKREAELIALKSQINPHFLYNTLDSIRMMAIIDDKREIAGAIEALANIFRYSIKGREDIVDIKEEIEQAMNYVHLQKIRYEDKFEVIADVDEQALGYKAIKFSLQPIVENAIFHGIENKKGKGALWISVKKSSQNIVFEVRDDGVGMDETKLAELVGRLSAKEEAAADHLGLNNVHDRIRLYFGEGYGLSIDSKAGEGTSVTLTIPAITSEEKVMRNVIGHVG